MIKRLSQSVREYKRDAILTPVLVVGEVIMDVLIPMLISNLIDYGINAGIRLHKGCPAEGQERVYLQQGTGSRSWP